MGDAVRRWGARLPLRNAVPEPRSTFDVPDQGDEPVVWDAQRREFVPVPTADRHGAAKQWYVGEDAVGKAPPPREGGYGNGAAAPAARANGDHTSVAPAPQAPAPAPAAPRPEPKPLPRPTAQPVATPPPPVVKTKVKRRRRFPRLPKLRWIFAILSLLPLLLVAFGWWYANNKFGQIDRIEVSSVLTPTDGNGTNYLILGSDSREAVTEAGATDPNVQPNDESPSGQRSDTMLILRTTGDGAKVMSIPRDLFVTLPNGSQGRINGAYNDGPAAIITTIQQNLGIPINRYIEVDFVTFSSLVDALGGITLGADIIPCPAYDERAGLLIPQAGPVELDGATALGFVRSRHYTEICDGVERTDPTGDLGRITRQQAFLRTVLSEAGHSRNPLTLMRIASSLTKGLRIDDGMSLTDGIRFAWNMGKLNPESVVLPTSPRTTSGGAAVLDLKEDEAEPVLAQFR